MISSQKNQESQSENQPTLEICLFGAPQISLNGTPVAGLRTKDQALLFYLATTRQTHLRTSLATLLWGELPEKNARASLRKALQHLRAALPNHLNRNTKSVTLLSGETSLNGGNLRVDVVNFCDKIKRATQADSGELLDIDLLNDAIDLYQADFLTGFLVRTAPEYEAWQSGQQASLREMMVSTLQTVGQHYLSQAEWMPAIAATRRILTLEPWREESHRQLMKFFVYAGQRQNALVQYEICRNALETELDVAPSPQTVQLYQQIRDGGYDPKQDDGLMGLLGNKETSAALAGAQPVGAQPVGARPGDARPAVTPSAHLFGIGAARDELLAQLQKAEHPWLCAIDGIGGIGKTSLAEEVVHLLHGSNRFGRTVWISAKQDEFRSEKESAEKESSEKEIHAAAAAVMDAEEMIDGLLSQLTDGNAAASQPLSTKAEKQALLLRLLKDEPTLVVIDNLETVADYEALVPTLNELTDPSKVLITSRNALSRYGDIFCLTLGELNEADAFALLRYEANMRGIDSLVNASDDDLIQITGVVGGHPLALNLILGQLSCMPLRQVLDNLKQAMGQQVEEFYNHIYWQAWQALEDPARRLFVAMPMLDDATYPRLAAVTQIGPVDLQSALTQLIGLSLMQVAGDLHEPRYRLHRLTETFLMNEVLKWQEGGPRTPSPPQTPNGQETHGPTSATTVTTENETAREPIQLSPQFVAGPPITQPHLFFGRNEEMTRIFGWWQAAPLAHVALIGPRRSGKTSLLLHLQSIVVADQSSLRPDQKQDWLPSPEQYRWVQIDFQDPRMGRQERVLRHLLTGFGFDAPKNCSLETFMDIACSRLWDQPAIVLMDELGAGLAAPELDQAFWWTLRALTQATDGYLSFVVAAHDQPMRLATDLSKTSPFFNIFTTLKLGPFTQNEALDLITSSPIPFAETDINWILEQSERWPHLLQICCQERLAALEAGQEDEGWKDAALERMEPFL